MIEPMEINAAMVLFKYTAFCLFESKLCQSKFQISGVQINHLIKESEKRKRTPVNH